MEPIVYLFILCVNIVLASLNVILVVNTIGNKMF